MSAHVPLTGVIHQPAEQTTADLAALVPHQPGQAPQVIVITAPAPQSAGALSPAMSRLLIGAGIGAGAIAAVALVGPLLIVTLQSLAVAALALGGAGLALGVAAVAVTRNLRR